jgi:integrase
VRSKLTKRVVESIAPCDHDVIVWDTELRGFGCKITPKGRRSYLLYYRTVEGQQRKPALGAHGAITCEQAREIARAMLAEVARGGDPKAAERAKRLAPTIAELADRFLAEHAATKKRLSSTRMDRINLRLHVLPALGRLRVRDVTRGDIAQLHHRMRSTPGAANRVLALLSKMFNLAEQWGLRPDHTNPCRHIERYAERKMERYLSGEELTQLGTALAKAERDGTEMPSAIAAVRLLALTGARVAEILGLRWEHVDLSRDCLRLATSKTGRKVIHLNNPALEVLKDLARPSSGNPWVIEGAKPGSPLVNIRKPWHRLRKAAGFPDVRLHDLRHSFASVAVAGGLSLPIIGALLGHTQPATTARYAHIAADPLRAAAEAIGARLGTALAPPRDVAAGEDSLVPLKQRR